MDLETVHDYLRTPEKLDLRYFPHQVAKEQSDLAAVLLYDLYTRTRDRKKPLIRDRKTWTYDPHRVFTADHPPASEPGVRKAFLSLETASYIEIEKSGKYNRKGYDKKWWYHVTAKGISACKQRLIRYYPDIAAAFDIPKAVLLQAFRYLFHEKGGEGYVLLDPSELYLPYSEKTIGRHLAALAQAGILEAHPDLKHHYTLPDPEAKPEEKDWRDEKEPIIVSPNLLLPPLKPGEIGLLVGHSGTGKTSFSLFAAVQFALAGTKVLYISLEEPQTGIVNRLYAQEFGVNYSALHQGDRVVQQELQTLFQDESQRRTTLAANLRFVDLSGEKRQPHEVLEEINIKKAEGFDPDVVMIDQLELIEVAYEYDDMAEGGAVHLSNVEDRLKASRMGAALPPALVISDCLDEREYRTWMLHQVMGASTRDFTAKEIAGGTDVAERFDCVVGIGRQEQDSDEIRVFSLTPSVPFDQVLEADFPHMRFKPRPS